jgi:hypothetical protein
MLGAAGAVIPEACNKFGANCGPEAVWFKVLIISSQNIHTSVAIFLSQMCRRIEVFQKRIEHKIGLHRFHIPVVE